MRKVHYGFHGNIKKAENCPQVLPNSCGTGKAGEDLGSRTLVSYGHKSASTEDIGAEYTGKSFEGKGILLLRL